MGTQANLTERDTRLRRTRTALAEADLSALLVAGKGHWWTGRGYLRYFTDFHMWGHDGLLLIPQDSDPMMTFSSYAVARRIAARGWITDVQGDVYQVPKIIEMMKQRGLTKGRVGIAGYRWIMGAGNFSLLREALPDVEFVSADDLMDRIRATKSDLEITQIGELWELAKEAMVRFVEIVEPGQSQRALAAEASRVALAGGARDILVFMGENPGEMDPPRDVPVTCDGLLRYHMEICGESGHWCELTVNCAFTEPDEQTLKLLESELKAYDTLRALAKPGVKLSELARAFEQSLTADGWQVGPQTTHFDFHGQGMDTIERPWHAAESPWGQSQDWPLEAGMVFSYHPRREVSPAPPWSSGINEDILITEQGAHRLAGDWNLRWLEMKR